MWILRFVGVGMGILGVFTALLFADPAVYAAVGSDMGEQFSSMGFVSILAIGMGAFFFFLADVGKEGD